MQECHMALSQLKGLNLIVNLTFWSWLAAEYTVVKNCNQKLQTGCEHYFWVVSTLMELHTMELHTITLIVNLTFWSWLATEYTVVKNCNQKLQTGCEHYFWVVSTLIFRQPWQILLWSWCWHWSCCSCCCFFLNKDFFYTWAFLVAALPN